MLAWAYGSGFPKSRNQSGSWEGWGTALKPAWEPIVLARKPLVGTVAANLAAHGTGAINIDGCRIGSSGGTKGCTAGPSSVVFGDGLNGSFGEAVPVLAAGRPTSSTTVMRPCLGRFQLQPRREVVRIGRQAAVPDGG